MTAKKIMKEVSKNFVDMLGNSCVHAKLTRLQDKCIIKSKNQNSPCTITIEFDKDTSDMLLDVNRRKERDQNFIYCSADTCLVSLCDNDGNRTINVAQMLLGYNFLELYTLYEVNRISPNETVLKVYDVDDEGLSFYVPALDNEFNVYYLKVTIDSSDIRRNMNVYKPLIDSRDGFIQSDYSVKEAEMLLSNWIFNQ